MAAITTAVNRQRRGACRIRKYAMTASITIPKGAIVSVDATTGLAKNAVAGVADKVVGIAAETVTTPAAGGSIEVEFDASWLFAGSSIAAAQIGDPMLVVDNNTVDETSASSAVVGTLEEIVSSNLGWVFVPGSGQSAI